MSKTPFPVAALANAFFSFLREALSPSSCAACDTLIGPQRVFCPTCAVSVTRASSNEPEQLAFASFGGAIAVAIRRFKYEERPELGRPLGHLLRRLLREEAVHADVVVPVPLHPKRLAERGYNQAALLAAAASEELRVPLLARALRRERDTSQQARLGKTERLTNVSGAFVVRDPSSIAGKDVLLVDDVLTTGATLSACREALLLAQAKSVVTVCLARAGAE